MGLADDIWSLAIAAAAAAVLVTRRYQDLLEEELCHYYSKLGVNSIWC